MQYLTGRRPLAVVCHTYGTYGRRRGVYRALGPEQLTTVTDWQDPIDKQGG
jgi:hypothetical protein